MRLILGKINNDYLRNITLGAASKTEEVIAAVAYANDDELLFRWCLDNKIPVRFYGRLDDSVAVSLPILQVFIKRRSPLYVCKLVQHHHAKVIWWRNYGVYIGSANLTGAAWNKNIEAGCFFPEEEINEDMACDLGELFATLESKATPLTDELFNEMQKRATALGKAKPDKNEFWASPSFKKWPGLIKAEKADSQARRRQVFLEEWHNTLQELRDIGVRIGRPENRPKWVSEFAPAGTQTDQFLHAYYYQKTFDGRKANYAEFFQHNRSRQAEALTDAIFWWRGLSSAVASEDTMLNTTAPNLRTLLSEESLNALSESAFREICMGVHSIADYARRVPNRAVALPENGTQFSITEKVTALSHRIWNATSHNGNSMGKNLVALLYGGTDEQLPERLWRGVTDPDWKIEGLGISALGEIVGWALPDRFPPRNGRTSKALRALGYNVTIHVQ